MLILSQPIDEKLKVQWLGQLIEYSGHFWYQCLGVAFVSFNHYDTVITCAWVCSMAEVLQNMHMLRSLVHSLPREKWGLGMSPQDGLIIILSTPTHTQHSSASQTRNGSSKHP